jgi:preprotein translocase subunit SecE
VAKKDDVEAKSQEPKDAKSADKSAKDTAPPKANQPEGGKSNGGNVVASFVQGSKEELDKVVWPSRQQLISESIAVILMVTLSATLIYFVDNLFRWAAQQVF